MDFDKVLKELTEPQFKVYYSNIWHSDLTHVRLCRACNILCVYHGYNEDTIPAICNECTAENLIKDLEES